ncbi:MAG: hypothetical protein LUC88_06660, partial [Prevotella sp.]|nr:hypothetical protein [Prevotella sp.]
IVPTVRYWSDYFHYMREDSVSLTITTTEGYVTCYSPYSYYLAEGLIGGIISGAESDGSLDIDWKYDGSDSEKNTVPAGSSILIRGSQGQVGAPYVNYTKNTDYDEDAETVSESGSIMYGTVDPTTTAYTYALDDNGDKTTENYKFYKLSYIKNEYDVKELGFYWGAADGAAFPINPTAADEATYATGAKLAWMALGTGTRGIKAFYPLDVNATGIEEIEMSGPEGSQYAADGSGNDVIYNLQGIRVNNMSKKGIYIVNGKKVAIK